MRFVCGTLRGRPTKGDTGVGAWLARCVVAALVFLFITTPAAAQLNGHVSVMLDTLPDLGDAAGRQSVSELRARVFAERRDKFGSHLRLNLAGYVDGLVASRSGFFALRAEAADASRVITDAIVRPADLYVDIVTPHFDIRAGAARLVWGRLDEFQPTDVINPLDLSRFLMEGRSEARLPVGLVRARAFLPHSTTVEAVVVPHFRRGRFDQLDEGSSPFNLMVSGALGARPDIRRAEAGPQMQGGLRLTTTTARVDWSLSAYRGIKPFPISTLIANDPAEAGLYDNPAEGGLYIREFFPRFTMIGGDFETVHGAWGVRGEVAAFVEDELQSTRTVQGVPGRSMSAGVGIDRKAGDYRIAANVLWSLSRLDNDGSAAVEAFTGDPELERTDVSLVVAADRSFARETRTLRLFAVYDPADATTFTRVIAAITVRDNVWIEGSGGLLTGTSLDIIGRLTHRDFAYARLKVYF